MTWHTQLLSQQKKIPKSATVHLLVQYVYAAKTMFQGSQASGQDFTGHMVISNRQFDIHQSRLSYTSHTRTVGPHRLGVRCNSRHPYRMCDSETERKKECENEHWHRAHGVAQLSLARDLHSE